MAIRFLLFYPYNLYNIKLKLIYCYAPSWKLLSCKQGGHAQLITTIWTIVMHISCNQHTLSLSPSLSTLTIHAYIHIHICVFYISIDSSWNSLELVGIVAFYNQAFGMRVQFVCTYLFFFLGDELYIIYISILCVMCALECWNHEIRTCWDSCFFNQIFWNARGCNLFSSL